MVRPGLELGEDRNARLASESPVASLGIPREIRAIILAHEMAHVFQWAIDKSRYSLSSEDLSGSIDGVMIPVLNEVGRVEVHADETIMRWGFDPFEPFAWIKQHVEFREDVPSMRQKPLTRAYSRRKARNERLLEYHLHRGSA